MTCGNTSRPRTSVALCSFNGAEFIGEQLGSITRQSVRPDEIVVCDDRSEDGTIDRIRHLAGQSEIPIRLFANEDRLGINRNFERAVSLCSGDIIFLSDQDDVWVDGKVEAILHRFSGRTNVGLIFTDAEVVRSDLTPLGYSLLRAGRFGDREQEMVRAGQALDVLLRRNVVTGATMAFRAEYRSLVLPVPDSRFRRHDEWIAFLIAAVAEIAYIPQSLIRYRQHAAQDIGAHRPLGLHAVAAAARHNVHIDNVQESEDSVRWFRLLRQRLEAERHAFPIRPDLLAKIDAKIDLQEARARLPAATAARTPTVVYRSLRGDYHRYSKGWLDAMRDVTAVATVPDTHLGAERHRAPAARGARPIRVTHVITKGAPMGGSQIDTRVIARFAADFCEVDIVAGSDGPLPDACLRDGLSVTVVPMINALISPVADLRSFLGLVVHFVRRRPDIVHTHTSKAGILGRLAAAVTGVPVVVHTVHIPPFHEEQPYVVRRVVIEFERFAARFTDRFIVVAPTLGNDFVETGICSRTDIETIASPIDFSLFPRSEGEISRNRMRTRSEIGIEAGVPLIVGVANLEFRKRYDVFVRAASIVRASIPSAVFLIVGSGEEEGSIRQLIDELDVSDCVALLGRRDDVPEILAAADIFVQTSQLEGLSRSLLEAAWFGLPVVATNANATSELVRDGVNGFLVDPGDDHELAARLIALIANPSLAASLGRNLRMLVDRRWSVETVGRAHMDLYRRLLEGRGTIGRRRITAVRHILSAKVG